MLPRLRSTMMRDKSLWGEDAETFNPARWLGKDSAAVEKYYMPVSTAFLHCKLHKKTNRHLSHSLALVTLPVLAST